MAELRSRVAALDHACSRTRGTTVLHAELRDAVSRRDLAALVDEHRRDLNRQRRRGLLHVAWHHPNLVWAIDATTIKTSPHDPGVVVVLARDLASHFHFEPLVLPAESAARNLEWLRGLLRRHPPPLLLKRDNGSPFNEAAFDAFLAEQGVIALNSPVRTPRYNGAIEHGVGSFKAAIEPCIDLDRPAPPPVALEPLVYAATLFHNVRPRRSLRGLAPAEAYFQTPPLRFTRRQRHAIFEWISAYALDTLKSNRDDGDHRDFPSAWRTAVVAWLRCQDLITISHNHKLSPLFDTPICS